MNRAERRHQQERIKAKFSSLAKTIFPNGSQLADDQKWVGRTAAMHCTCDCWMCTIPELRRSKPTFDESNPPAFHRDSPDGVWSVCDELRYDKEMKRNYVRDKRRISL